eukprot:s3472_g1.t1
MAANPLDVATDLAGVDLNTDVVARYLRRIGIKSHATISTYLHDNAAINDLIAKLKAGVQVGDTEFKLADSTDEDALKAPWIHAYQSAMTSTASPSTSTPPPTTTTYGTETVVNRYVDWFIKLVRKHAQRIPNVKSLWKDFPWDIAMRMRANETFQLITEDLMSDITRVTDTMQQPLTKRPRTVKGADSKAKARDTSNVGRRQARDDV